MLHLPTKKDAPMEDRYYIRNAPETSLTMKTMGCQWDQKENAWYTTDVGVAVSAQRLTGELPPLEMNASMDRHYIWKRCPKELNDLLKEHGCKWDPKGEAWYTNSLEIYTKLRPMVAVAVDWAEKITDMEEKRFTLAEGDFDKQPMSVRAGTETLNNQNQGENKMERTNAQRQNEEQKYFIGGDTYGFKEQLKAAGCHFDKETKDWYHTNEIVAATVEKFTTAEPVRRYMVEGNTRGLKEELKELGCQFDGSYMKWYAQNEQLAMKASALTNGNMRSLDEGERYYINNGTPEIKEQLKEMGCKWDAKNMSWYAPDQDTAIKATELAAKGAQNLRYYIDGDASSLYKGRNQLKEAGCKFDSEKKQWYAPNKEVADKFNQEFAPKEVTEKANTKSKAGGEKLYIRDVPKELKELRAELKKIGCKWDLKERSWYAPKKEIADRAEALRLKTISLHPEVATPARNLAKENPVAKSNGEVERLYVRSDAPKEVNSELRTLGCKWDNKEKAWYHTDPEKQMAANAIAASALGEVQKKNHEPGKVVTVPELENGM